MKKTPLAAAVQTQNLQLLTYLLNTCNLQSDGIHPACLVIQNSF